MIYLEKSLLSLLKSQTEKHLKIILKKKKRLRIASNNRIKTPAMKLKMVSKTFLNSYKIIQVSQMKNLPSHKKFLKSLSL